MKTSCFSREYTGQFILVNDSSEIITLARIEVCKQFIEVRDLKPHGKFNAEFKVTSDSHYDIAVYFASGKNLTKQIGYVTRGFDFKHTLVGTDADITLNKTQVE
jgi:hypothetical protein